MTGAFDPAAFDSAAFDTGDAEAPDPPNGGAYNRRPMQVALRLEPEDQEEAALIVALLRHRFRL